MVTESKRIKNFRLSLAREIPKFPNDRATKQLLEQMRLKDLLIVYMNWRLRFVRQAIRAVSIESTASTDPRWQSLSTEITVFLQRVKDGEDLTPYLSHKALTRGFTPASTAHGTSSNRWVDKDFLLYVMGLHHFHLLPMPQRTEDVLFVSVSRDAFEVIGIFNHDVFENDDPIAMKSERERLWKIYEARRSRGATPGSLIIGGFGGLGITMASGPLIIVMAADTYLRKISEIDPQLDDFQFLQRMFAPGPVPKKQKFQWKMECLDLGVVEKTTDRFFTFQEGPN